MDWIQGERFIGLADLTFAPPTRRNDDYDGLPSTFTKEKAMAKLPCVIYTHTMYVKQLFGIIEQLDNKFIVISHNGDVNIDFEPPANVIKWFTQNVDIINHKIDSIPIGLENNRWFANIHKKEKMLDKLRSAKEHRNLVYINHNVATNPLERQLPYQVLEGKPWVTSIRGTNGHGFDQYLDNVYNHKFVVCPRGNGIDTHRLWETLYMRSIPIVRKDINNWFYSDLPILFVTDWTDITEAMLNDVWNEYKIREWNMNKLRFTYWKDLILNSRY